MSMSVCEEDDLPLSCEQMDVPESIVSILFMIDDVCCGAY